MQKLDAVEQARRLMTEGQNWPAWRWLLEKGTVREAADRATEALAAANRKAKDSWADDLKQAYAELAGQLRAKRNPQSLDSKVKRAAQRVKEVDDQANQMTADAEAMFAEAERRFDAEMARAAAQKALESYDLREKAIRAAEAARRTG